MYGLKNVCGKDGSWDFAVMNNSKPILASFLMKISRRKKRFLTDE